MNQHVSFDSFDQLVAGDPVAKRRARNKADAIRCLPYADEAVTAAFRIGLDMAARSKDGELTDGELRAQLRLAEAVQGLFGIDQGNTLPDFISSLRHDLGISQYEPGDVDLCGRDMGVVR